MAGRRKRKASDSVDPQQPVKWIKPKSLVGRRGTEFNPELVTFEVDGVSAVDDQGRNSPPVIIEGIEWYIRVRTESSERTQHEPFLSLYLYCRGRNHLDVWYADVMADVRLLHRHDRAKDKSEKFSYRFSSRLNNSGYASFIKKAELLSPAQGFIHGDKVKIEVSIAIMRVHGLTPIPPIYDFSRSRDHLTNGIIVVEGKNLYISKEMLALHSPVFQKLFFGEEHKGENQDEVELVDIKHNEIVEFLDAIYTPDKAITPMNVKILLQMAKHFENKTVMSRVEHFLCTCFHYPDLALASRLRLADKYNLYEAQHAVLHQLKKLSDVVNLKNQRDYVPLSDTMKLAVTELQLKLSPKPDVINVP